MPQRNSANTKGMDPFQRGAFGVVKGNTPSSVNWQPNTAVADSGKDLSSAGGKYQLAVQLAKDKFKDDPDVNQSLFRQSVDDIYGQIKDEKDPDAAKVRGEDGLQQFGRAIGEGIDFVNNGIGTFLDNAADFVIGGIADWFGAGDDFRNLFNGEDLAVIPDMLEDVALGALGPVGIAAAVGKNAAQRTDQIVEALSGRDSVTGEEIGLDRRIGKGGEALLGTALSALPGVGKLASKGIVGAEEAAAKAAKAAAKQEKKARPVLEKAAKNLEDLTKQVEEKIPKAQTEAIEKYGVRESPDFAKEFNQNVDDLLTRRQEAEEAFTEAYTNAIKPNEKLLDNIEKAAEAQANPGLFQRAMNRIAGYKPGAEAAEDISSAATKAAEKEVGSTSANASARALEDMTQEEALEEAQKIVTKKMKDQAKGLLSRTWDKVTATPRPLTQIALPASDVYMAALGNYGLGSPENASNPLDLLVSPVAEFSSDPDSWKTFFLPMMMPGTRMATNAMLPSVSRAGSKLTGMQKPGKISSFVNEHKPTKKAERGKHAKGKSEGEGSGAKEVKNSPNFKNRALMSLPFQGARSAAAGNLVNRTASQANVPEPEHSDAQILQILKNLYGVGA